MIRRSWTPVEITQADKDRYWEDRFRDLKGRTLIAMQKLAAEAEFPENFRAYAGLILDSKGCLWVKEQSTHLGEGVGNRSVATDSSSSWTVFDSTGRWIASAQLPSRLEVFEIGADYVLGKQRVSQGVEQVIRYRLSRRSGVDGSNAGLRLGLDR